jgi:hypothetical protein
MGGSTDPAYAVYGINDVNAPSGGEASWAFFKQFTLHGGNVGCRPGSSAPSSPVHAGRPGPYSASASAILITAEALAVAGQREASHLEVAPVSARVDSAAKGQSPNAVVEARSVTTDLLSPGTAETYGAEARQTAPSADTAPVHAQTSAVPAGPVFNADLATADVHARWGKESDCMTDGPIATTTSTLLNAQLQPDGADDGGSNWHGNTLGMDDYISPAGTATSTGVVELMRHESDDRYSLHATATTQVTGINVTDALYVEVVSPAKAEVVATGEPGTAAVAVSQPVLRAQGATLVSGRTFTSRISGGPVVEITPGIVTKRVARDGTLASASGTLAHIRLLDATGTVTVADLTLGSIVATATVPPGGVSCRASSIPSRERVTTSSAPAGSDPAQVGTAGQSREPGPTRPVTPAALVAATFRAPVRETVSLPLLVLAVLGGLWLRRRPPSFPPS